MSIFEIFFGGSDWIMTSLFKVKCYWTRILKSLSSKMKLPFVPGALQLACRYNWTDVGESLLQRGVPPDQDRVQRTGDAPLIIAAR